MPALFPLVPLLNSLNQRNSPADPPFPLLDLAGNPNNTNHFDVICAWPVSGQYGPGTRFLYYVLVATCVLGKNSEWLKGACLAAALLLPAVAALHGIVLAAVHVDGAVDMDVYGAFQLLSIGVLAGPLTVRISATYFNAPGRNLIFLWTGMVLAGLLSLTVEFFRATPQSCLASDFAYGTENTCNITCSPEDGPYSPLRGGSQNNIYVIESPRFLSFGTATLLSAACCIPAILSLVSMWNKILKLNWTKLWGSGAGVEDLDKPISGTNAATPARMMKVNDRLRFYLSMVEIPVFVAAILAILAVGERNFFDNRVNYMTEPIASVGQWAPIVGTGLAAMGSLYALVASGGTFSWSGNNETIVEEGSHHCSCSHHRISQDGSAKPPSRDENEEEEENDEISGLDSDHDAAGGAIALRAPPSPTTTRLRRYTTTTTSKSGSGGGPTFDHRERRMTTGALPGSTSPVSPDAGSRRRVARAFEVIGDRLGTPAPDAFDDSAFQQGRAAGFPTVPGEEQRNAELPRIQASYNPRDFEDGNGQALSPGGTALKRSVSRSRAASFVGSEVSGLGIERLAEVDLGNQAEATSPVVAGPSISRPSVEGPGAGVKTRRATLEVPTPVYLQSPVHRKSSSVGSGSGSPGPDRPSYFAGSNTIQ